MPTTVNLMESGDPLVSPMGSCQAMYEILAGFRSPYLDRAREASKYTIPDLLPEAGANGSSLHPSPESSFGASAVNNLAAKIVSVLLPPDSPFFVIEIERPPEVTDDVQWAQIELESRMTLASIEKRVMTAVDTRVLRADSIEAMKHLIVAGNICMKLPVGLNDRAILYPLNSYVCHRDPRGHLIHLITAETIPVESLPMDIREACDIREATVASPSSLVLYTRVSLNTRTNENSPYTYEEIKELNGYEVPGSRKTYSDERKLPYLVLPFERISGESYGRGLVEQYQGDLLFLNQVSGAIKDAAVIASQVRWLVNPNGLTDIEALNESETGGFVVGLPQDVQALQVQKSADMQFADATLRTVEQRLSSAFLLTNSVRRDAERVTAYEINAMKQDLDTTLGGVYSTLSQEFQMPLLENLFESLRKARVIPGDIDVGTDNNITVRIISGITGLGRGNDLQRYDTFLSLLGKFAPESFSGALRFDALASRVATSLGINPAELIKTPEERQAEQQQQMAQQAAMGAANNLMSPQMIQAASQAMQANQAQGAQ